MRTGVTYISAKICSSCHRNLLPTQTKLQQVFVRPVNVVDHTAPTARDIEQFASGMAQCAVFAADFDDGMQLKAVKTIEL